MMSVAAAGRRSETPGAKSTVTTDSLRGIRHGPTGRTGVGFSASSGRGCRIQPRDTGTSVETSGGEPGRKWPQTRHDDFPPRGSPRRGGSWSSTSSSSPCRSTSALAPEHGIAEIAGEGGCRNDSSERALLGRRKSGTRARASRAPDSQAPKPPSLAAGPPLPARRSSPASDSSRTAARNRRKFRRRGGPPARARSIPAPDRSARDTAGEHGNAEIAR
jgi:hypothetical protein